MKHVTKFKSELTGYEVTFIECEKLNKLKDKALAPKKLAGANELLRKLKTPLPK